MHKCSAFAENLHSKTQHNTQTQQYIFFSIVFKAIEYVWMICCGNDGEFKPNKAKLTVSGECTNFVHK